MIDGFMIQLDQPQKIAKWNQVVARLNLPAGEYLIFSKANVIAIAAGRRFDYNQIFESKLICNNSEDTVLMSLFPRIPTGMVLGDYRPYWVDHMDIYKFSDVPGGRDAVISMNLGVSLDVDSHVEMIVNSVNSEGIMVDNVSISAIRLGNLTKSTKMPLVGGTRNPFSSSNVDFTSRFEGSMVEKIKKDA
ncbi:MAG: hypothetical protein V4585_03285 [Bacteroidota bacterium]